MKLPFKISISVVFITMLCILFLFNDLHHKLINIKKDNTIKLYHNELVNLKNKTDLILSKSISVLSLIAIGNSSLKDFERVMKHRLEFYLRESKNIIELEFISLDGKELVKVSNKQLFIALDEESYSHKKIFQMAVKDGLYLSDIYYTDKYNEMVIDMSVKVIDINTKKPIGVIVAKISINEIQEMINDKLINVDAIALLNINNGKFIYRSSLARNINDSYFDTLKDEIVTIKSNGKSYLMASSIYKKFNLKIKFFLLTKESNIFADINQTIKDNFFLLFLTIIVSVLITFLLIKYLFSPLTTLTTKIKVLSINIDPNFKEDIDPAFDEIDEIEFYFENFVKLINADRKKLQEYNENLQHKIDEEVAKNQEYQTQIFKSEKMASMGQMIGNIAHQWRQPLSVITMNASSIQLKQNFGKLTNEYLTNACDNIEKNAQYLSKTIDDFRNFIKEDKVKVPFNLTTEITTMLSLLDSTIKTNFIQPTLKLDDNIEIVGYKNELLQCMINILNNSIDVLHNIDINNRYIFIETTQDDTFAIIKFRDNGGGIDADIIDKVFEPYFTTKHKTQGTGLGLSMTYNLIVNGMKGDMQVANSEYEYNGVVCRGVEFIIKMPLNM